MRVYTREWNNGLNVWQNRNEFILQDIFYTTSFAPGAFGPLAAPTLAVNTVGQPTTLTFNFADTFGNKILLIINNNKDNLKLNN